MLKRSFVFLVLLFSALSVGRIAEAGPLFSQTPPNVIGKANIWTALQTFSAGLLLGSNDTLAWGDAVGGGTADTSLTRLAAQSLALSGTAPLFNLVDTTASAKSLTIAIDANLAQFRESAGASLSGLVYDLENGRLGVGLSPTQTLHVGEWASLAEPSTLDLTS